MAKGKKSKLNSHNRLKGYLFLTPFIFGFIFYFVVIISNSIQYSFSSNEITENGLVSIFSGWSNYSFAFTEDPNFVRLLVETLTAFLYNTPIIVMFSLFIAVILNLKIKGRVIFRAIFFVPVIVATGLIAKVDSNNVLLTALMSPGGIDTGGLGGGSGFVSYMSMQQIVLSMGLNPQFTNYVLNAVNVVISSINQAGVQILIFLSGLQSIPLSVYEAADIEGASAWESFWKITFPMISPLILVNLFYTVIDYFTQTTGSVMNYISDMTFGRGLFNQPQIGPASAMAWIYFACIAVILAVLGFIVSRFVFYQQREH